MFILDVLHRYEEMVAVETSHHTGYDPREVQSRGDLARYLSQSLPGEYRAQRDETDIISTSTYVKSYLLEAHRSDERSTPERLSLLFPEVSQLADPTLFRTIDQSGHVHFVDTLHSRFQIFHSIQNVEYTDRAFDRLTGGDLAGFDRFWFPSPFLETVKRGRLTGFKFSYQSAVIGVAQLEIDSATGETQPAPLGPSSFRLEASEDLRAAADFAAIVKSDLFRGRKSREQLQFRSADVDEPEAYIINGIYYYGKIVGKGTSIGGHLLTVDALLGGYAQAIERIEEQSAIGWVPTDKGHLLHGEPFIVRFPDDIEILDLARFTGSLFRAAKPFRLFGIPHGATDNRIDVEAIDLHTGDPLSFEITKEWMRIYLPRGSCGNIIARLYANLQHGMSSEIRLTDGQGRDPFDAAQW